MNVHEHNGETPLHLAMGGNDGSNSSVSVFGVVCSNAVMFPIVVGWTHCMPDVFFCFCLFVCLFFLNLVNLLQAVVYSIPLEKS